MEIISLNYNSAGSVTTFGFEVLNSSLKRKELYRKIDENDKKTNYNESSKVQKFVQSIVGVTNDEDEIESEDEEDKLKTN